MAEKYEYRVETSEAQRLQKLLNDEGEKGWRVAAIQLETTLNQSVVILERKKT